MSQPLKGFCGTSYQLDALQFDCQRSIGLYPEADEMGGGTDSNITRMVSTPGLVLAAIFQGNYIRGLYEASSGAVYFVCSNTCYQLNETNGVFTVDIIGYLVTSSGPVNFADNAGIVVLVDGPNGYYWQNSTFTQINDPSWQGANFVVLLADQFIFNVPGSNQFYWSDINSITFTTAGGSGVDAKQGNSDPIAAMQVYGLFLWLVGTQTTEVWTTNPSATTSYQRIPGPYIQSGALAGQSFCYTEFGGIWLSQNPRGGAQVVMTPPQGYTIARISTFAIEQVLQKYSLADIQASTAFVYQKKGHVFYQLNPGNGLSSWVYDITLSNLLGSPQWHERTYTNPLNQQSRHLADNHAILNGYHIVGDYSAPKLYVLDSDTFTDNGHVITRERTAPHVSSGFNRIFYSAFTLEMQTGLPVGVTYIPPFTPDGNNSCGLDSATPTLTWNAAIAGTNPVVNYAIYRSTSPTSGFTLLATVGASTLTYTDTTGTSGTTYYYYIYSVDSQGTKSAIPSATMGCSVT
jgi:hypothetical protein